MITTSDTKDAQLTSFPCFVPRSKKNDCLPTTHTTFTRSSTEPVPTKPGYSAVPRSMSSSDITQQPRSKFDISDFIASFYIRYIVAHDGKSTENDDRLEMMYNEITDYRTQRLRDKTSIKSFKDVFNAINTIKTPSIVPELSEQDIFVIQYGHHSSRSSQVGQSDFLTVQTKALQVSKECPDLWKAIITVSKDNTLAINTLSQLYACHEAVLAKVGMALQRSDRKERSWWGLRRQNRESQ